jgi:hypothetical protein
VPAIAQSDNEFNIEYTGAGGDGPSPFSQDLQIVTTGGTTFDLGAQSEYTIRITKPATGEQVTLPIQSGDQTYTVSELEINPGNLIEGQTEITIQNPNGNFSFVDVEVQGELSMFQNETFAKYEVQVVDQSGNAVATTEPRSRGVRYELEKRDIEYNGSAIAISRPPGVDSNWYVALIQNKGGFREEILEFNNQPGTDFFVASIENTDFNDSQEFGINIYKNESKLLRDEIISPSGLKITDEQRVSGPVGNRSQSGTGGGGGGPSDQASPLSLAGTVQQSAAPGETARVSYTISNVSDQSSVAINITELPDPVSVNTSASATNDGTFEANGQQVLVSQPAGEQTLTIAYDIDASASADATLDIEAAALNENDTATDTVTTTVTVEQQTPSGAARPDVTAVSQPSDSVSANSSFEIDYRITNPDEAPTAFTFTVPTTSANLSVTGFAGEIQGPNPDGTPPSTSTTAVDPGQTASVTVTYRVAANATGTGNITVEASSAFLNGTGAATTTVELGEPAVPTTPRGRALQVAGVEDPAAIGQRDITVAITLRDRGQPTNGVNVSQRDITTLITLRDRARESQPSRRGY